MGASTQYSTFDPLCSYTRDPYLVLKGFRTFLRQEMRGVKQHKTSAQNFFDRHGVVWYPYDCRDPSTVLIHWPTLLSTLAHRATSRHEFLFRLFWMVSPAVFAVSPFIYALLRRVFTNVLSERVLEQNVSFALGTKGILPANFEPNKLEMQMLSDFLRLACDPGSNSFKGISTLYKAIDTLITANFPMLAPGKTRTPPLVRSSLGIEPNYCSWVSLSEDKLLRISVPSTLDLTCLAGISGLYSPDLMSSGLNLELAFMRSSFVGDIGKDYAGVVKDDGRYTDGIKIDPQVEYKLIDMNRYKKLREDRYGSSFFRRVRRQAEREVLGITENLARYLDYCARRFSDKVGPPPRLGYAAYRPLVDACFGKETSLSQIVFLNQGYVDAFFSLHRRSYVGRLQQHQLVCREGKHATSIKTWKARESAYRHRFKVRIVTPDSSHYTFSAVWYLNKLRFKPEWVPDYGGLPKENNPPLGAIKMSREDIDSWYYTAKGIKASFYSHVGHNLQLIAEITRLENLSKTEARELARMDLEYRDRLDKPSREVVIKRKVPYSKCELAAIVKYVRPGANKKEAWENIRRECPGRSDVSIKQQIVLIRERQIADGCGLGELTCFKLTEKMRDKVRKRQRDIQRTAALDATRLSKLT